MTSFLERHKSIYTYIPNLIGVALLLCHLRRLMDAAEHSTKSNMHGTARL